MTVVPRSGGEATRAGVAYEDAIILSYLVEILDGTAPSFALEGSTIVEGFEGALVRSSGTEQLQCKRSAHTYQPPSQACRTDRFVAGRFGAPGLDDEPLRGVDR